MNVLFSQVNTLVSAALLLLRPTLLWLAFLAVATTHAQQPFITTWKTDYIGASNSTSITIPTTGSGYNYDVDWNNDGIYDESGLTGSVTHDFGVAGTYTIRIRGAFPQIYFNNTGDKRKLTNISQWGSIAWTSMEAAFQGCENLQITTTDLPDLTGVTNLSEMFSGCTVLNGPTNIGSWDISGVTTLSRMFVSNSFFNQPVGTWNTANVTDMESVFFAAANFNQPLSNWNTAGVTTMRGMFYGNFAFNQAIGNWNTANVTDMSLMFNNALIFNQVISNWNTANVTDMSNMFFGARQFNQPIGNWNTDNVTNMRQMFQGAANFNQPISNWNTANVTDMTRMFESATAFNQSLGNWTLNAAVILTSMLSSNGMNCSNYSATLYGWSNNPATPANRALGCTGRQYGTNVASNRTSLINSKGWTFNGDASSSTTCSFVLPISLTDFTGKRQDNRVLLEWETAEEQDNLGFYIERSADGLRWSDLGFVAGNGTISEKQRYFFFDEQPFSATNFYRLRQTDFDGTETLSKIVRVVLPHAGAVRVFPNPVRDGVLNLFVSDDAKEDVVAQLFSPTGQCLHTISLENGHNFLNISGLSAGVYMLQAGGIFERIIVDK